ncbi:MAG: LysR family transcriptional regulator, partial [Erysipelotrichaceae bacterium]|nr:LysR family transcriptional regulator [Erysipelotrichaceae bacterium]
MTLRHLEIFMCVCRHMSMTAAGEELNMSQPAVSKAIGELEAFYHTS